MRRDMSKLLCERPRIGVKGSEILVRRLRARFNNENNFEEAPKRTGMGRGRLYGYECKELNEYLNPLARFLESKVGQHWDDVYSEIREYLGSTSAIHMHIMQHLWQYVDKDVKMSDQGILVRPQRYSHNHRLADDNDLTINGRKGWTVLHRDYRHFTDLFVHPITGVLCKTGTLKPEPKTPRQVDKTKHRFGHRHFVKVEGIWYEYDIVPLPDNVKWAQIEGLPPEFADSVLVKARYHSYIRKNKPPRLVRAAYAEEVYGALDIFFGPTGGKTAWNQKGSHVLPPDLRLVKGWYGSLKVYCPGTYKQCNGKTLRKVGLKND